MGHGPIPPHRHKSRHHSDSESSENSNDYSDTSSESDIENYTRHEPRVKRHHKKRPHYGDDVNKEAAGTSAFGQKYGEACPLPPELSKMFETGSKLEEMMLAQKEHVGKLKDVLFEKSFTIEDLVTQPYVDISTNLSSFFDMENNSSVLLSGFKINELLFGANNSRITYGVKLMAKHNGSDELKHIGQHNEVATVQKTGETHHFNKIYIGDQRYSKKCVFFSYPEILDSKSFRDMAALIGGTPVAKIKELINTSTYMRSEDVFLVDQKSPLGEMILRRGGDDVLGMVFWEDDGSRRWKWYAHDIEGKQAQWIKTQNGYSMRIPKSRMKMLALHYYEILEDLKDKHVILDSIVLRIYPLSPNGFAQSTEEGGAISDSRKRDNLMKTLTFTAVARMGVMQNSK